MRWQLTGASRKVGVKKTMNEISAIQSGLTQAEGLEQPLKLELDLNVLNHLGINLYSNTPAVLTEIVANAWDADAKVVDVTIDDAANTITISDDGMGMDYEDLKLKFLTVGYPRRDHGETASPGGRQCMGRKGIGKLAMFSLAKNIVVVTRKTGGSPYGLIFSVVDLKARIKEKKGGGKN